MVSSIDITFSIIFFLFNHNSLFIESNPKTVMFRNVYKIMCINWLEKQCLQNETGQKNNVYKTLSSTYIIHHDLTQYPVNKIYIAKKKSFITFFDRNLTKNLRKKSRTPFLLGVFTFSWFVVYYANTLYAWHVIPIPNAWDSTVLSVKICTPRILSY